MSDEKPEHVLTFESSDYYGPELKLTIDCSQSQVDFTIEGEGSGVLASVRYSLIGYAEVEQVIAALTAWRERQREQFGR
jgi:hypothetical protein